MRIRADENPHSLPPRLYERTGKRRIVWWTKERSGHTRILRHVPISTPDSQVAAARAHAITLFYTKQSRQEKPDAQAITAWIDNAGYVDPKAIQTRGGIQHWARKLWQDSKRRATQRGVTFTLTLNEFAEIVDRSAGFCEVSGHPLTLTATGQKGPYGPSIDRLQPLHGYTASNVRIVCVAVNFALNSWGLDAFMPLAKALVNRHADSKHGDVGI